MRKKAITTLTILLLSITLLTVSLNLGDSNIAPLIGFFSLAVFVISIVYGANLFRTYSQEHVALPKQANAQERRGKEMHKLTCADCQKEIEVPFKPNRTIPFYCRGCSNKRSSARLNLHPAREDQELSKTKKERPTYGVPVGSIVKTKLYRIVYKKIAELTLEEELFVKRNSGSNEGKLRSAPEGPTYYTYDDMFDRDLFSDQEQVQFAGIIETLEKEMEKREGLIPGYVEFVFDHEKKLGSINENASTALYRILFKQFAELTEEENAVINTPNNHGSSMFILDSVPTQLFYLDNTHLEAIVNMYGERKFERLVKILKEEIEKNEYCGCVELLEEYV